MFSRQRTSSMSSGVDRIAPGRPSLADQPSHTDADDAHAHAHSPSDKRRKSFMGIHFHRDKDKAGKDAAPAPPPAPVSSRQGRQSMDHQRMASFTRDPGPVRNSMSDVARPARIQTHGHGDASSPRAGHRIVSQPSFPSFDRPGVGIGVDDAAGPDHQEPRERAGSFAVTRGSPASLDASPSAAPPAAQPFQQTQPARHASPPPPPTTTTMDSRSPRTSSSSRSGYRALTHVLQSYMDLNTVQANKLYASSPPELEMIFARQTNGSPPKKGPPGSITNDWDKIWLQLTGTSLSIWSMKETADAAKRGERIPPTYHNITDSTIELLNPLPAPPHRGNSKPYPFCFSLNTAGSNRILLSCPSEQVRTHFVSALRLSAWEKSRLEEIYTAHLLRTFITGGRRAPVVPPGAERPTWNEPDVGLVGGKMEGWVRVRVMGTIEWKRLWMVLSSPAVAESMDKPATEKKRKSLFSFGGGGGQEKRADERGAQGGGGVASTRQAGISDGQGPSALFYRDAPVRGKAAKHMPPSEPLLEITHVTQAYAVYPEQTEVIPMSNLLKVSGRISGELVVVEGRTRLSGWAMIMCERQEQETAVPANQPIVCDMLRWAIGFHDAFGLYGRPKHYSWDKTDPASLFFGYQDRGPNRLFLETAQAATIDPNLDNIAHAREIYADMVSQRMYDDFQSSRTTTPSQYSHTSRDTQRPPVASGSHSSLNLARQAAEQPAPLEDHREQQQEEQLSSDEEDGQYEDHASGGQYRPSQDPEVQSGPMMPHRADTLTPITERSDVASRKTSIGTMNTLDRARGMGGSQSSAKGTAQQGSGSGSSHLGRNPSTGTRLVEPMVVEEVLTLSPAGSAHPQLAVADANVENRESVGQEDLPGQAAPNARDYAQPPSDALGLEVSAPRAERELAEVVAPKPQKPTDAFDEDTVLQDNAYLLDQIALESSPEKPKKHLSPIGVQSEKRPDNLPNVSPSLDRSSRSLLGRKPSGARAMPPKRQVSGASQPSLQSVEDDKPVALAEVLPIPRNDTHHGIAPSPSLNADAMAALTFLDEDSPRPKADPVSSQPVRHASPEQKDDNKPGYRSSFAPSKAAQDRRNRAQEAEKHRDNVRTKPGVRRAPKGRKQTDWSASSSDDEDSEVDDESDSGSDGEKAKTGTAPPSRPSSGFDSRSRNNSRNHLPHAASQTTLGRGNLPVPADQPGRVPRNLPPIPGSRAASSAHPEHRSRPGTMAENARSASWTEPPQYGQLSGRNSPLSASMYNSNNDDVRHAPTAYRPPPRTSNMWNSDLDAPHLGLDPNDQSQKFIQLEPENAQMTKAFTPHGLLQAGLQDREDRSAKRQEENAKETGSSLVNVPNKPPPPQAGLLGAITAHERDRKAPGGIGAALTERERDRRLAEERQRQIDDLQMLQRQTMFGQSASPSADFSRPMSAYGGSAPGMAYPMQMSNPSMMWGMANPYAAQAMMAANMAYQNSLYMAMSAAGSQYGGGTPGGGDAAAVARATSPMMSPPMMPPPMMSPASAYMMPGMNMGFPGYPWGMPPPPPSMMMPAPGGQNGASPNAMGESQGKGE